MPDDRDELDAAVRRLLHAEAAAVDAARLWGAVEARLAAENPVPARRRSFAAVAALAGLAACLLAGLVLLPTGVAAAGPAEKVQAARRAAAPADREYRLTVELPAGLAERFPALTAFTGKPRIVTTAGGMYVVRPDGSDAATFGRDAAGRMWVAPTAAAAARFAPGEVPPALRPLAGLCDLNLHGVLGEFVSQFVLKEAADGRIVGVRRGGPAGPFRPTFIALAIDPGTKTVRELRLVRPLPGGEPVTVKFEWLGPAAAPKYDAEQHLSPAAPIYDADRPLLRRRVMARAFGDGPADRD